MKIRDKIHRDFWKVAQKYKGNKIWVRWEISDRKIIKNETITIKKRKWLGFIAHFLFGMYYRYPLCCTFFYATNYNHLIRINKYRRKITNFDYILCRKCYNKL